MSTSLVRSTVGRGRRRHPSVSERAVDNRLTTRPPSVIYLVEVLFMRRTLLALALLGAGCITGSAAAPRGERMIRELSRQERWSQQAIDARPNRNQLETIRGSDYGSVAAARKELTKLVMSIDRGTWIRETTAEMMREDHDPQ